MQNRVVVEALLDPMRPRFGANLLGGFVKKEKLLELDRSLLGTSRCPLSTADWDLRGRHLVFVHNTSPRFWTRSVLQSQRPSFFVEFKHTESSQNLSDSHVHVMDFNLATYWIMVLAFRQAPSQRDVSNALDQLDESLPRGNRRIS